MNYRSEHWSSSVCNTTKDKQTVIIIWWEDTKPSVKQFDWLVVRHTSKNSNINITESLKPTTTYDHVVMPL